MCIYLTTRHVHRDGRADSVSAEWELCPESNGRQPCPNKQRRERIVSTSRHKRNATIGSVASASTVSSTGPATPSSSYRDDPYVHGSLAEGRDTPTSSSGKAPQRDWSPLNEGAHIETRRPSGSSRRHTHRYRMSIDETLAADGAQIPVLLRQSSPSSGTSSEKGPMSLDAHEEEQDDSAFSDRTARRIAVDAMRKQERERRREGSSSKSSATDSLDSLSNMSKLRMTDSQERKEHEELMWDAHEIRTAQRLEARERLREENRRRRLAEEIENDQGPSEPEIDIHDEDLTRARLAREMAELEVQDGLRQQHDLEQAQLLAEKAVLEKKITIASIEHRDAAEEGHRLPSTRELENVSRRRSQLGGQRRRHRDSGSSSRAANSTGRTIRTQELRDRIRENEQALDAVEARIRERQRAEEKRQRHIKYLEQMIKVLDRKIEARSQYASPSTLSSIPTRERSSPQHTSSSRSSRSSPREPMVEPAEDSDRHTSRSSRHRRRRH